MMDKFKPGDRVIPLRKFHNIPFNTLGVIKKIQNRKLWVDFEGFGVCFAGTIDHPFVEVNELKYEIIKAMKENGITTAFEAS